MLQINPAFVAGVNSLAALAYVYNIDCPPLRSLARWTLDQGQSGAGGTGLPAQRQAAGATPTTPATASYDDAVLAAITSSPNGVELADLATILKHLGPATKVNPALGRLAKAKKIEKKGGMWYATAAAAPGNGNVDRTMGGRRAQAQAQRPRRTRTRKAKAAAGAGTDAQQTAGAAD